MYICLCNAVTENDVHEAKRCGAKSLCDLKDQLGVATGCGQCAQAACAMLDGKDATSSMPLEAPLQDQQHTRLMR